MTERKEYVFTQTTTTALLDHPALANIESINVTFKHKGETISTGLKKLALNDEQNTGFFIRHFDIRVPGAEFGNKDYNLHMFGSSDEDTDVVSFNLKVIDPVTGKDIDDAEITYTADVVFVTPGHPAVYEFSKGSEVLPLKHDKYADLIKVETSLLINGEWTTPYQMEVGHTHSDVPEKWDFSSRDFVLKFQKEAFGNSIESASIVGTLNADGSILTAKLEATVADEENIVIEDYKIKLFY